MTCSLIAICAIGCMLWSGYYLWILRTDRSAELNSIAFRILSGDAFQLAKGAALSALVDGYEAGDFCVPAEARAAVTIRLRLFEEAVDGSTVQEILVRRRALRASVRYALKCTPTDAFLWFLQYWLSTSEGGPVDAYWEELRLSYQLGPYEGWVAARRNAFVLAIYEVLPPDLKRYVVGEYVALVDAGFIGQAVRNLKGAGWEIRDILLPRLITARLDMRIALNEALQREGIDVDIPGTERRERRPWR